MYRFHRGFTRSDLIASMLVAIVVVACATIALGQDAANGGGGLEAATRGLKDGTQVQMIHKSFQVFAADNKGRLPLPGLINRQPDPGLGNLPGVGPEDDAINTTANLHSAMIAQNYFNTDIAISPIERNSKVMQMKDYNYNAYRPANDVYWDSNFKADLATVSYVSYANLMLVGARKREHWIEKAPANLAHLSNRGPKDGKTNPDSITCGPHGNWAGHVIFGDNHRMFVRTTEQPDRTVKIAGEREIPDNLFAIDDGMTGSDIILSMTKAITKDGAELQWD